MAHPVDPPASPPRRRARRRVRTRGGGWLLSPSPRFPFPESDAPGPLRARPDSRSLAHLESALDARSALDRCRWLRLQAEAARWE